jgi:hypothetical protein
VVGGGGAFPEISKYYIVTLDVPKLTDQTIEIIYDLPTAAPTRLQLMLVLDTTGSMGDEITYLKAELANVISRIAESENVVVELAILLYRDLGDEYVTQYYDFTTDIASRQKDLSNAFAGGGGDTPEAVDIALDEAVSKQSWSTYPNVTRVILHVLDAPPHDGAANIELYKKSIETAAEQGIAIIPVASSGIDKETEYLLRTEALLTAGRYVFITNDSGIGGDHIEASVGAHTVEYLNSALLRLLKEFITGEAEEPIPYGREQ